MKPLADFMQVDEMVTRTQFDDVERFADNLFQHLGIDVEFSKHFKDRTNDARNHPDIEAPELIKFFQAAFAKQGKHIASLGDGADAILNDVHGNLNLPFVLKYDKQKRELELVAKTIMRTKTFLSHGQRIMRF